MRALLLSTLLLVGCPSPGLYTGITGVKSQQGYTLNTTQKCVDADLAVRIADIALPIYFSKLSEAGYIKDRSVTEDNKFMVCLIQKPEPCSFGGWTKGPLGPTLPGAKYPLAARKNGCASQYHAWNSKEWPPICRPEWPDEPHCVGQDQVDKTTSYNWKTNYVHELLNMVVQRWTKVYQPDYQHKLYSITGAEAKKIVLGLIQ